MSLEDLKLMQAVRQNQSLYLALGEFVVDNLGQCGNGRYRA